MSAGSIGFGYRVDPTEKGKRLINDGEAAVVKRIFTEYADGQSPRALAAKLNREKVPGPKGREWGDTTIRGQLDRGTGLLNNELYIGRLVWDRCSYVKNMTTGRRQARPKDQSEWVVTEVPELRIIDDELWQRVKARQAVVHTEMRVCGSPFVVQDYYRYGCNRVRSKGNCSNTIKVPRAELEQRLTAAITAKLMDRSYFDTFILEIRNQLKEKAKTALDARKPFEKQLTETRVRIRRLVKVLEETDDPDPSISDRLRALRIEEKGLVSELDALTPEALIVPSEEELIEAYGRCLFYLRELADPAQNPRGPNQLIREAISRIILTPTEDRTALVAELEGSLPSRFLIDSKENSNKKTLPAVDTTGSELSVVAGARFELTTFRL